MSEYKGASGNGREVIMMITSGVVGSLRLPLVSALATLTYCISRTLQSQHSFLSFKMSRASRTTPRFSVTPGHLVMREYNPKVGSQDARLGLSLFSLPAPNRYHHGSIIDNKFRVAELYVPTAFDAHYSPPAHLQIS